MIKFDTLIRAGFTIALFFIVAAVWRSGSTAWEFAWQYVLIDLGSLSFIMFVLPMLLKKPTYGHSILIGTFTPVRSSWAVWLFWLGLVAFGFHFSCAVRQIIEKRSIDYHIVRSAFIALWLWLTYKGCIPKWRS